MASLSLSLPVPPSFQGWGQLRRSALADSGMGLLNMINGPNHRDAPQIPASGVTLLMAYTLSGAFTYYYGRMGKGRIYENSFPFSSSSDRVLTLHSVTYYVSDKNCEDHSTRRQGLQLTIYIHILINRFSLMPDLDIYSFLPSLFSLFFFQDAVLMCAGMCR